MGEEGKQKTEIIKKIRSFEDILCKKIKDCNNIFICGHIDPDFDALASIYGVSRICKYLKKYAYAVIPDSDVSQMSADRLSLYSMITNKYISLSKPKKELMTEDDLLIIVDVQDDGRIPIDDYDDFKNVIIIDHHKTPSDKITCQGKGVTTLSIENVSSTSEIVYYLINDIILANSATNPIDLSYYTALLAGIYVDTHQCEDNVYPSTYHAVSELFELGADKNFVNDLFSSDFKRDKKINELVYNADFYTNRIAIAVDETGKYTKEEIAIASDRLLKYKVDLVFVFGLNKDGKYDYSIRTKDGIFGVAEIAKLISSPSGGRENAASGAPVSVYIDNEDAEKISDKENIAKRLTDLIRFKREEF